MRSLLFMATLKYLVELAVLAMLSLMLVDALQAQRGGFSLVTALFSVASMAVIVGYTVWADIQRYHRRYSPAARLYRLIGQMQHHGHYVHPKRMAVVYFGKPRLLARILGHRSVGVEVPMWADADHEGDWNADMPPTFMERGYVCDRSLTSVSVHVEALPLGESYQSKEVTLRQGWKMRNIVDAMHADDQTLEDLLTLLREAQPYTYPSLPQ